jgi:Spy/CpxP family protein refolding chaperone
MKTNFKRFFLRITVVLLGCVVVALPASAFDGGPRHHGEKGTELGFGCLKQLDLTDAQKSGISEIMEKYDPQHDALRNRIHEARQEMQTTMNGQPFDEAQVRAAYQAMNPLREELFLLNAKMKSEIRSLLTADQLKALEEKRDHWCEKGRERGDHRQAMTRRCPQTDMDETP